MFILPDLPYGFDALAPVISDRTMHFHHDKHHGAYVETTNKLLGAKGTRPESLEAVVQEAASSGDKKLFDNAAQAWNHGFFWEAMTDRQEPPPAELASAVSGAFGDLKGLKSKFVEEGAGHFGSGWVWLVADRNGRLSVISTHDADDSAARQSATPLIVCDLWEHAYYLDYQNERKRFLEAWFDHLANWSFASRQYAAALKRGQAWRYPAPGAERRRSSGASG